MSAKKQLKRTPIMIQKAMENGSSIQEYSIPKKHRELVTKLVEILQGANKSNAMVIEQNINAFHQTKDITIPSEKEAVEYNCGTGNIKKPKGWREAYRKKIICFRCGQGIGCHPK